MIKGYYDLARMLVSSGVNLNAIDRSGVTPLYHAILLQDKRLIRLFLAFGADLKVKDYGVNDVIESTLQLEIRDTFRMILYHEL